MRDAMLQHLTMFIKDFKATFITKKRNTFYLSLQVCVFLLIFKSTPIFSCGVNSHMWISDTAMCQLKADSPIRTWLNTQSLVDLVRVGSFFPDSGYTISHPYGELTHWSPFVNTYIENIKRKHQGDYQNQVAKEEIAFLFGVAAHGFEDEVFDTIFLRRSLEIENVDQDLADPGLDLILITQGKTHLRPPLRFPAESVTSAIIDTQTQVTTMEVTRGMGRAYLATALLTSTDTPRMADEYGMQMPWVTSNYDDFLIPGSLSNEPFFVAELFESIWAQINGTWSPEDGFIGTLPMAGSLIATEGLIADQTVSFIFSLGMLETDIRSHLVVEDEVGVTLEYDLKFNRWSNGQDYSRVIQVKPIGLVKGRGYYFRFLPGIHWVNGQVLATEKSFFFYAQCEDFAMEERCLPQMRTEGQRGGDPKGCLSKDEVMIDAGLTDTGMTDSAVIDSAVIDAALTDAAVIDANIILDRDINHQNLIDQMTIDLHTDQGNASNNQMDQAFDDHLGKQNKEGCDQTQMTSNLWMGLIFIFIFMLKPRIERSGLIRSSSSLSISISLSLSLSLSLLSLFFIGLISCGTPEPTVIEDALVSTQPVKDAMIENTEGGLISGGSLARRDQDFVGGNQGGTPGGNPGGNPGGRIEPNGEYLLFSGSGQGYALNLSAFQQGAIDLNIICPDAKIQMSGNGKRALCVPFEQSNPLLLIDLETKMVLMRVPYWLKSEIVTPTLSFDGAIVMALRMDENELENIVIYDDQGNEIARRIDDRYQGILDENTSMVSDPPRFWFFRSNAAIQYLPSAVFYLKTSAPSGIFYEKGGFESQPAIFFLKPNEDSSKQLDFKVMDGRLLDFQDQWVAGLQADQNGISQMIVKDLPTDQSLSVPLAELKFDEEFGVRVLNAKTILFQKRKLGNCQGKAGKFNQNSKLINLETQSSQLITQSASDSFHEVYLRATAQKAVILDTDGCDGLIGTGRVFNRSTSEMEDLPSEINGKIKAIALNKTGQWVVFLTDEGLWLLDLSNQRLQLIFSGEGIGDLVFY